MKNLASYFVYDHFVLDKNDQFIIMNTENDRLTEEYFNGFYPLEKAMYSFEITRRLL